MEPPAYSVVEPAGALYHLPETADNLFHEASSLRVVKAEGGTVEQTSTGTAASDAELMQRIYETVAYLAPAFGGVALGKRANRQLGTIITPSFEAFKIAREARRAYNRGETRSSRDGFKEAVELDPDFAVAWRWYANTFFAALQRDSASWAYREALAELAREG